MTDFSPSDLLLLAELSSAAYLTTGAAAAAAVESLGLSFVAQVGAESCSALIVRWGGTPVVAFQGTRVLENADLDELWDDVDCTPMNLGHGMIVHEGFWRPLSDIWPEIGRLLPNRPCIITGHSLGGVRAHLARRFWPYAEVVSFGAPKGANGMAWIADSPPTRVVFERDFAPVWPYDGPYVQPGPMLWLHNGQMIETTARQGLALSIEDHSIDNAYIPALKKLAGVSGKIPAHIPYQPVNLFTHNRP